MLSIAQWLLIISWAFVIIWIPIIIKSNSKVHPKALFILFFAEMWERFSYYGMRALLTLYMVKVLFEELSQTDADARALGIYGSYTAMVYLFPVVGGILADKILGFRKAIIFGGILMMFGHFALALEGMYFEGNLNLFFMSLSLIIIGNGFFKPNVSSFLGKFYFMNDPRKDSAFTIFYMGVNIGALFGRDFRRQSNNDVARGAEGLHRKVLVIGGSQSAANVGQVRRFRIRNLDQRAAGEIQPEIEAAGDQRTDARQYQHRRENQSDLASGHEIDAGIVANDVHAICILDPDSS
jgi:hypothetical protein